MGTAYIIERDGTIYEVFEPNQWGFHLGLKGDDDYMEKHSIGIEIVSLGQLEKVGRDFIFYPMKPLKKFPKIVPESEVVEIGDNYFHAYTPEQITALSQLIPHLVKEFEMPIESVKTDFYAFNDKVIPDHIPGIWSHTTVRKDKSDIYPDPNLIAMLNELKF